MSINFLRTDYATGSRPYAIKIADVNGDGLLDLISSDYFSNDVSIMLGNGNGTFQSRVVYATGGQPISIAVAEISGDDKADLVVANNQSEFVSVLLGNGDGTFQSQVTYPALSKQGSLTAADVNGDGEKDIVETNYYAGRVSILLGNGDGSFQPPTGNYQTASNVDSYPISVAVADINGDGKGDLVVGNNGADVSVLLGNGDGTFQSQSAIGAGNSNSVAVADLNGDGNLDVVTSSPSQSLIAVVLGNGDGTFQPRTTYNTAQLPYDAILSDVDDDGQLDIVSVIDSGNMLVLLGNGDGTFQSPVTFSSFGASPFAVAAGDLNGDGHMDVVTSNFGSDTLSVFLQNNSPTITSNGGGNTAAVSVAENTTAVTTVAATDPDAGQTLSYAITGGADAAKFTINETNGALAFITAPDFEIRTDAGANNVYDVTVQASDGFGGIDTQAVAVTVTNQHEAPATASATVTAAEDTTYTFTLADFAFNDADQPSDALRHIVITSIPAAGTLALDGVAITAAQVASGLVVSPAAIASGLLTFTAGADANGSDYATFDFHVRDDGVGAGTAGTWTFSGSGADDSGNDHHLALTGGAGFAPGLFGEALALDGAKGSGAVLSTDPSAFDFGSSDFTIELWVKFDDLSRESTLIEKFTNDSGPGWTFTVLGDHRLQFYAAGVAVLTSDPLTIATGEWHQFVAERSGTTFNLFVDGTQVLSGSGGGAIIPSSGPLLIGGRNTGDPRNFTVDGVVDNVTIWDHALSTTQISQHWNGGAGIDPGENVSQTATVTIDVSALNDPPTITSNGGNDTAAVSIAENTTAVTTVVATDSDAGQTLTYSITGGADSNKFSINATTGALAFLTAPNFEAPSDSGSNNVYDVTVQAADGNGGVDTQAIAVTVTDEHENQAPTITSNGGNDTAAVSIAENTTAVTTVVATDPDAGQTLTYSITGGADSNKFSINATTGALAFLTAPNFEAPSDAGGNNVYDLTVQASDGNGGIDTQAIAVTVQNANEAPTITSNGAGTTAAISVAENTTTAVMTVTATDPDAGQTLTYSITGGADSNKFSINATTGALTFVTAPNFEAPSDSGSNNVYDVTVQAADGNGGIDTQAIAVTVTNVAGITLTNDAATITGTDEEDVLTGGSGNNTLQGLRGNDSLNGGDGNDNFLYQVGDGADRMDGGKGADTLTITGTAGADTIHVIVSGSGSIIGLEGGTVTNVEKVTLDLLGGTDTLSYAGTNSSVSVNLLSPATATGFNSISGVENVTGGSGNDNLTGNSTGNAIDGGAGADTLFGGGGSDNFVFTTLANSRAAAFDTINDFTPGADHLQIGHELMSLTTGTVKGTGNLSTDLANFLNANNLVANGAAEVTIKGGKDAGTYVVINDSTPGYNASNDGVIMLVGAPVLHTADFIL
ncbi:beta strand repeat-containing protein [Bradyrhizobium sp. WBAH23]|uniref:beta strand repeat-containing protein n=1 Tax=Bradyrhizobium sp. WBAH23 TaxID=1390119 RepID=UPI00223F2179|nr:FG-GAP-like repeat-containing protein [Bradyrhizobium sp. WBAH23]